jgi:hypothetical protein
MKLYTHEEFMEMVAASCDSGPEIEVDGHKFRRGKMVMLVGVEKQEIDGMPVLIVEHVDEDGKEFGVIMDRQYANELLERLGPHPMVEEYFRVH